ncbi:MAG: hypothetical protein II348_01400 [Clostridia bacterium]|nr:hypothetical protein [Clostridia bacterium]
MIKKHWFKLTLLALAAILGVVVWGLLDTLWHNMEEFEAASETGAITEYFAHLQAENYEPIFESSGFEFNEKNTREDYVKYLQDSFGTDFSDLRFAGRDSEVAGEKIYRIYSGNTPLGEVNLIPQDGDRNWRVSAVVKYADPITLTAPSHVTVYANGVAQTGGEAFANPDFKDTGTAFEVPQQVTYPVEGYLYAPKLSGTAANGTPCAVKTDEETGECTMFVAPSEVQRAEYEAVMKEFSQLYACYIAKDSSFARLRVKMDTSTPFYKAMSTFSNYWYNEHSGYEFRNWELFDIECSADGFFSGSVKFDHIVFWRGEEKNYASSYRLSFRQVNGQWLLVDLKYL